MSDQANPEKASGAGHGRRAVMAGAAAVGVGAVAAMAGPAMAATAATSAGIKGAVPPARPIVVRLPPTTLNIDQSFKVLQNVLNLAGCGGCYSGFDITFIHELEYFVNANGEVQPGI